MGEKRVERELATADAKLAAMLIMRQQAAIEFGREMEIKFREIALNAIKNPTSVQAVATQCAAICKTTNDAADRELQGYILQLAHFKDAADA